MLNLSALRRPEQDFFFGAPIAGDSELATEDPLALDYIAQQVGLLLLPGLTTRSSRAQGFAMVVYGLHLVERALTTYDLADTDDDRRRLFERWERFWALATLELREGQLARSDRDSMRGVRGAVRAWFGGAQPLPLDFPMISRQQELGNLGAYLVPLRRCGLIIDGTIRPSPAALDIIDAFWDEPAAGSHASRFEDYALAALNPRTKTLERKLKGLTLATVGERSRLTALTRRGRAQQQDRLYDALFTHARDNTSWPVAQVVQAGAQAGLLEARDLLDAALAGSLGGVSGELRDLLWTARAFGDVMAALLAAFDRAYAALDQAGWMAPPHAVAAAAFPQDELQALGGAAAALLAAPRVSDLRRLPMHGGAFLRLVEDLRGASAPEALERMLTYHGAVQRERRRGAGWISAQGDQLVLSVTTYTARPAAPRFPPFKTDVVRSLLIDTGRLADDGAGEVVP